MRITLMFLVALSSASVQFARGDDYEEVCCVSDPSLGCYSDAPPHDHLPVPDCDVNTVFVLYSPEDMHNGQYFTRWDVPPNYIGSRRTIIIIHGYQNDEHEEWLEEMRVALLQEDAYNIIIVGWGDGADSPLWSYDQSAANIRVVAKDVSLLVENLVRYYGATYESMWCIGHSLGAHTCGLAGMETHLGRVTGLDPAGPDFEDHPVELGVNPSSADFVDILHTDGKSTVYHYGQMRPLGHIDFYPNGGGTQPGCWTLADGTDGEDGNVQDWDAACSHGRARNFFTESIGNDCFTSCSECPDEHDIPDACTACTDCAIMGYGAEHAPRTTGLFYLKTGAGSDNSPYCEYEC